MKQGEMDIGNFILQRKLIRKEMDFPSGVSRSSQIIKYLEKQTTVFDFQPIETEKLLAELNNDKPAGTDNLDGRSLSVASNIISLPICHIINLSVKEGIPCFTLKKKEEVVPLQKNKRESFSAANSKRISILPMLSKLMEKVVLEQRLHYSPLNELNSDFQPAYKADHSTCTTLIEMT